MKTTKKHFAIFKRECERLWKLWGLSGWELVVLHQRSDDGKRATCQIQYLQRRAIVRLHHDWGKDAVTGAEISNTVRHEMCHVLVGPMSVIGASRYATEDELDAAEHEVVKRLMAILP